MKRILKLFIIAIFLTIEMNSIISAQTTDARASIRWIVRDSSVSRLFIGNYIETKDKEVKDRGIEEEEQDKVQKDDQLIVEFNLKANVISEVKSLAPGGIITSLDMNIIREMDPLVRNRLKERRYRWDEAMQEAASFQEYISERASLFDLRTNRRCQDAFWWPPFTTQINLPSHILTRITDDFGIEASVGNEEYGYLWGTAGTARTGLANRFAKLYMTVPLSGITKKNITGGYGLGLSIDTERSGGGIFYQNVNPDSGQMGLQIGSYIYYSNTHDLSRALPQAQVRWKMGPAVFLKRRGDDQASNPNVQPEEKKLREWNPAFYARIEFVMGEFKDVRLNKYEFAIQTIIGSKKHLFASMTYNLTDWFGLTLKVASIIPADAWHSDFNFLIEPQIRL